MSTQQNAINENLQNSVDQIGQALITLTESLSKLKENIAEAARTVPANLPVIEWVSVPAGMIKLQGQDEAFSVDSFSIAKYPITNEQFNMFLQDPDGYANPRWWEGMPKDARRSDIQPVTDKPNHPRVNVTFYDATAFCRWLSDRMGYEITLPDECQWQQAATGGDPDNAYPWGAEFDKELCNTWESGIGTTTPVDKYPEGATKQGAMDMVGNAWEWCKNREGDK